MSREAGYPHGCGCGRVEPIPVSDKTLAVGKWLEDVAVGEAVFRSADSLAYGIGLNMTPKYLRYN